MNLEQVIHRKQTAARMSRYGVYATSTAPNIVSGVLGGPPAAQVPESAPVLAAEVRAEAASLPTFRESDVPDPSHPKRYAKSGGLYKTESSQGKGAVRFEGASVPKGSAVKRAIAYSARKPVVSDGVAKIIDGARDLDDIQANILMLRRAATLYARGFRHSKELDVVVPPNFHAQAAAAGLPVPDVETEITGALPAEMAPAEVVNIAQGEMVGKDGDPQAAFRAEICANHQPKARAPRKLPVGTVAAAGVNAVSYTPESSYETTIAGNALATDVGVGLGEGNAAVAAEMPVEPVSNLKKVASKRIKKGLFVAAAS